VSIGKAGIQRAVMMADANRVISISHYFLLILLNTEKLTHHFAKTVFLVLLISLF
jgi:hypothetical protein